MAALVTRLAMLRPSLAARAFARVARAPHARDAPRSGLHSSGSLSSATAAPPSNETRVFVNGKVRECGPVVLPHDRSTAALVRRK